MLIGGPFARNANAILIPHVAAGRVETLADRPLQLKTGYCFVHAAKARSIHLLTLFRD